MMDVQLFCTINNNLTLLVCSQMTFGTETKLKCFSSSAHLSEFLASFSKSSSWASVSFKSYRKWDKILLLILSNFNCFAERLNPLDTDNRFLTFRTHRNPKLGCINLTISSRISNVLISPSNRSLRSMYWTCGDKNWTKTGFWRIMPQSNRKKKKIHDRAVFFLVSCIGFFLLLKVENSW